MLVSMCVIFFDICVYIFCQWSLFSPTLTLSSFLILSLSENKKHYMKNARRQNVFVSLLYCVTAWFIFILYYSFLCTMNVISRNLGWWNCQLQKTQQSYGFPSLFMFIIMFMRILNAIRARNAFFSLISSVFTRWRVRAIWQSMVKFGICTNRAEHAELLYLFFFPPLLSLARKIPTCFRQTGEPFRWWKKFAI